MTVELMVQRLNGKSMFLLYGLKALLLDLQFFPKTQSCLVCLIFSLPKLLNTAIEPSEAEFFPLNRVTGAVQVFMRNIKLILSDKGLSFKLLFREPIDAAGWAKGSIILALLDSSIIV